MINAISIINLVSFFGLLVILVGVFFKKKERLPFQRWFIFFAFFLLLIVTVTNLGEHTGLAVAWDEYEDIPKVLFFPVFIFAIYSGLVKKELDKRMMSEKKLSGILNQTFTFIGLMDREGRLLEANATALSFLDIEFESVKNKLFWETPWWTHSTEEQNKLKKAIASAKKGNNEHLRVSHPDATGRIHYVDFSVRPITDSDGKVVYLIPEGRDITEIVEHQNKIQEQKNSYEALYEEYKQLSSQLREAKDKAEESDMLKSAFLANMSHEIRTPMNGIIGFSQLLNSNSIDNNKVGFYTQTIIESCNQLLSVVEDILNISRIETGQEEIYPTQMNVNELFDEINTEFANLALQKNIELQIEYTSGEGELHTDYDKLRTILQNIVSNAVKFTVAGKVLVSVELNEHDVLFCVKDTGIGIAPENKARVYDRFWRAELSSVQSYGGTGLGLTIAKAYTDMLKGKIRFESELGKGSTFYVSLPSTIKALKT